MNTDDGIAQRHLVTWCGGVIQEEVVLITLNKYRKAHRLLQDAEGSHAISVRPAAGLLKPDQGQGVKDSRSMSVTREITRVVRV